MSWRIVMVSSLSKLDYKMDYLVVRNRDGTTRIHLSEISILVLYGIKSLLCEDELAAFYHSALYEKLDLLLIEPYQREPQLEEECVTIIGKDLCVIY